ncbi:unnamed protein product [Cuscuta epithymum]|uniref:Uncharacterized protein n=1 Tax=Cuscuta epithymum TaxID=186058 RepID=A0AAV0DTV5_9ASTE|nr:unnamed protein product [Cuscuta epithymum]
MLLYQFSGSLKSICWKQVGSRTFLGLPEALCNYEWLLFFFKLIYLYFNNKPLSALRISISWRSSCLEFGANGPYFILGFPFRHSSRRVNESGQPYIFPFLIPCASQH